MTKKSKTPSHVTAAGTRKYQANGPTEWSTIFREIAEKVGGKGTPEGVGIRAALAFAVRNREVVAGGAKILDGHLKATALVKAPKAKAKTKAPKPAPAAPAKAA